MTDWSVRVRGNMAGTMRGRGEMKMRAASHIGMFCTVVLFFALIGAGRVSPVVADTCGTVYDDFSASSIDTNLWMTSNAETVLSQSNGFLNVVGPPNKVYAALVSTATFSGDFEFVTAYENFSTTASVFTNNDPLLSLQVAESDNIKNYVFIFRGYGTHGDSFFANITNGEGYNGPAAYSTSGMLKLTRTGSTINAWYTEDMTGSNWNLLKTFDNAFTGDVVVQVGGYTGDNGTFTGSFDRICYTGTIILPVKPTYSISGTITSKQGVLAGATVTLGGASTASTTTGTGGTYTFSGLATGVYSLTPSMTNYTFSPTYKSVNINDHDKTGQDFTATGAGASVPGAPTGVKAVAGDSQAAVSFKVPSSTGGSPILSYTVTSSPDGKTATGTSSPIVVTGLTNGTAYKFTVAATNAQGTGAASSASAAVTPNALPGAPAGVTATAGNALAVVAFAPPSSTGGSAVKSYTVTSSPDGKTAKGTKSPLTVKGLTNGTTYTFTVTATNLVGTGPASDASVGVVPATLPGAPTGVFATAGNSSATVTFSPPASDGGGDITSYTVLSSPGAVKATGTSSPITVDGLTNGKSYTFSVQATNWAGTGKASAKSSKITPKQ